MRPSKRAVSAREPRCCSSRSAPASRGARRSFGSDPVTDFVLLFPGQGSQKPGMGKDLAEAFPAARAVFEEADAAFGGGFSTICFEGPADELTLTHNAQPALLAHSAAVWAVVGH